MQLDSLPPINAIYPNSLSERHFAQEVYEYAVFYAIKCENKGDIQRYMACVFPFYLDVTDNMLAHNNKYIVIGLKLLYLLVENRLGEFHCEVDIGLLYR